MKCIMYHYVRNHNKEFPFYNIIPKKKFINQLEKFSKIGLVKNYEELLTPSKKILLTFDDGFKDHIFTAELLRKKNATGLFFIPTLPYKNKDLLDVHKTHLIKGKIKGKLILEELNKYLIKNKINNFFNRREEKKFFNSYKGQNDDTHTKHFKKIMNYFGDLKIKHKILNHLLNVFEINIKAKNYYLSKKEIKYISAMGMIIGSHAESHTLLSRLNYQKQYSEIKRSKIFLENIIKKKINSFCYPYGGKNSYNKNTIKVLKKLKFKIGYNVNCRDITKKDILNNPLELPRYDCNKFS